MNSSNWLFKISSRIAVVTMMAWTGCTPDKGVSPAGSNTAGSSNEAPGTAPTIATQASASDQKLLTLSAEETKNYLALFPGFGPTSKFRGATKIVDPKPGSTVQVVIAGREVFLAMPDNALPQFVIVAIFDPVEANNLGLSGGVQSKSLQLMPSAMTVVCIAAGLCAASDAAPAGSVSPTQTETILPVPSTEPTEVCCACVYQDSETGGGCAFKEKAVCDSSESGGCAWDSCNKVCYPRYQADCVGEHYSKFFGDGACTRTNTMSSNVIESWLKLPRGECKSMNVFYTGHGKRMATELPGVLSELYPGSDNKITDTGCNGLVSGRDDEAFRSGLCDKLKAAGISGSITTTGQQSAVRVHEALTSKTIKISWTPPDATCKEDISYGSCANSRKECDQTEAKPPTPSSYLCNTGNGITTKTCSCTYLFEILGCSYK